MAACGGISLLLLTIAFFGVTNSQVFNITADASLAIAVAGYADLNPTLDLMRGQTYTFNLFLASDQPFYISTSDTYSVGAVYSTGVAGNGNYDTPLVFTVDATAPDTLYYVIGNATYSTMNGTLNISGSVATLSSSSPSAPSTPLASVQTSLFPSTVVTSTTPTTPPSSIISSPTSPIPTSPSPPSSPAASGSPSSPSSPVASSTSSASGSPSPPPSTPTVPSPAPAPVYPPPAPLPPVTNTPTGFDINAPLAGLPTYGWIAIGGAVLVILVVIIAVAIAKCNKGSKKKSGFY